MKKSSIPGLLCETHYPIGVRWIIRKGFSVKATMKEAKDYIIFPLDVSSADEARQWVDRLHMRVGMFKIGLELFLRTGPAMVWWVVDQAAAGVFLDLKLHDIPNTVMRAMQGVADLKVALTTVHCGESRAMLEAAVAGGRGQVGVLGVTVLTSVSSTDLQAAGYGPKMSDDVGRLVLRKAEMAKAAGCVGVVCSGHEVAMIKEQLGENFIAVVPGIRPAWQIGETDDQQRVTTPAMAVADGADYLVIGRPIRTASDPVAAAKRIADEIGQALR
jgi:orotidine-5'-phosphate decarboxylase